MNGVTESAGARLKQALDDAKSPEDQAVRYQLTEGRGELTIDRMQPDDVSFDYAGRTVLVVDPDVAEAVDGRKLDYNDGNFSLA